MVHVDYALVNSINSYQGLNDLVRVSEVNLSSFFGSRIISAQGHEGSVLLDEVAKKWGRLNRESTTYSIEECRAAIEIQNKLLNHYRVSDAMIGESYNVFVVFSRVIKSCISFFLELFGIPADFWLKSSDRINLECAPEKIHMGVLDQAKQFGLHTVRV